MVLCIKNNVQGLDEPDRHSNQSTMNKGEIKKSIKKEKKKGKDKARQVNDERLSKQTSFVRACS